MTARIRVVLLYGGRSSEHEVSLLSARCVLDNLDPARFDVLPVGIDRDGVWHAQDTARLRAANGPALPIDAAGPAVALASGPEHTVLQGHASPAPAIDVVFPVMHGPLCEDGSIQGLLATADVPHVGCGVLGSAVCMDKDVAKRLVLAAGLATPEYLCIRAGQWPAARAAIQARILRELGYPVFVKPASLGSSVGISRVSREQELDRALQEAFAYDRKVLVERAVDAREIELSVLSSLDLEDAPEVSIPGEIVPQDAFYSYERKYLDPGGAELRIPAPLTRDQTREAQENARTAFVALECDGMARIDLFLERPTGRFLFNEANTIPGFTTTSMYAKLWEHSGLGYRELLSRLIDLALTRQQRERALSRLR
jgi:D-alanine-D-alanine ligase